MKEGPMLKLVALPALLFVAMAVLTPAIASAEDHHYREGDRGYYGNDYYGDRHAEHEYREHLRHEWREREHREHEWREHQRHEWHEWREHERRNWRNGYDGGYYDQFGHWNPYPYGY
jgi:hypothetical protein